jgi:hypothetical protein
VYEFRYWRLNHVTVTRGKVYQEIIYPNEMQPVILKPYLFSRGNNAEHCKISPYKQAKGQNGMHYLQVCIIKQADLL